MDESESDTTFNEADTSGETSSGEEEDEGYALSRSCLAAIEPEVRIVIPILTFFFIFFLEILSVKHYNIHCFVSAKDVIYLDEMKIQRTFDVCLSLFSFVCSKKYLFTLVMAPLVNLKTITVP